MPRFSGKPTRPTRPHQCLAGSRKGLRGNYGAAPGTPTGRSSDNNSPAASVGRGAEAAAFAPAPPDADAIMAKAADLLLVMAHADTVTKARLSNPALLTLCAALLVISTLDTVAIMV